jgi:trans-aconitate 2-methyltransferase
MADWNPKLYLKFDDQRTRPARDLLARIPLPAPSRVVDLGCGPGNSTELLVERWRQATVIGIDNSPGMLDQARKAHPDWRWEEHDVTRWQPAESFDVVYSNAALQWVGEHATLFPRLLKSVAPGGFLAVQMPRNLDAPSHALMRDTAEEGDWRERLRGARETIAVQEPAFYYDLLARDAARIDLWETEYAQVMESADAVLEWVRGTGLRPFVARLDNAEKTEFERRYLEKLRRAYTTRTDGKVLFPFCRIFIIAQAK